MAFFCTSSGARIVAPGVAISAGGIVPDHDGSPEHDMAEQAAAAVLASEPKSPAQPSSASAVEAAQVAALGSLTAPATAEAPPAQPADPALDEASALTVERPRKPKN